MALALTAAEKKRLHSLLFQYSGQLVQMAGPLGGPIVQQALNMLKQHGAPATAQAADLLMSAPFVPTQLKQFIKSLVYKAKAPAAPPPPPPSAPPVMADPKKPFPWVPVVAVGGGVALLVILTRRGK